MHEKMVSYEVEGHGSFPVDMLRYDCCWPKTETDSAIMDRSHRDRGGNHHYAIRVMGLKHPTEARWQSFGWKVREGSMQLAHLEWRSRTR